MARRILNRKELREDFDAAQRRQHQGTAEAQDELEDQDADEETDDTVAEADDDSAAEDATDEPVAAAPPKKRKPAAKPRSRSRAAKVVRMKVVWGVFNNSNQRIAVFDYPRRHEAEELAARLKADKKMTHFVQPVKEPIEEKKEP